MDDDDIRYSRIRRHAEGLALLLVEEYDRVYVKGKRSTIDIDTLFSFILPGYVTSVHDEIAAIYRHRHDG